MAREREVKLIVDDSFRFPDLADAVSGASPDGADVRHIRDLYVDTADLRLARWGCTFRHRGGEGWIVKLPVESGGAALARDEILFDGEPDQPPSEALSLVVSLTRGADVSAVAQLLVRRVARPWRSPDGEAVLELTDDTVTARTSSGSETSFRELEIELAPGVDESILGDLLARLEAAGARGDDPTPKALRALGPRAQEPADVVAETLSPDPTAAEVIRHALATSVIQLIINVPTARLGGDPEGVHQSRVATRQLRSDLRTFQPLLEPAWGEGLRDELSWLADELGKVRDADVLLGRLRRTIARTTGLDPDAAARVLALLEDQRRRDRADLLVHLGDRRAIALFDHLVDAAAQPHTRTKADGPARDRLAKLVSKRWRRLESAVDDLGRHPDAAALHRVRILAKRTRYAAEAVSPAFGKRARRFSKAIAGIQDALGEFNDANVAIDWLARASHGVDGDTGFTAGRLAQVMAEDAISHRADWESAYRRASRRKLRAWFD